MKFGLVFDVDEKDLPKDLAVLEQVLLHIGFRKIQDGFYVSWEENAIKAPLVLLDKLEEHAPWFCENVEEIRIFEVGSVSDITQEVRPTEEPNISDYAERS